MPAWDQHHRKHICIWYFTWRHVCGMAARKTELVAFSCWLVCVGGGIHSLTWPAMPKAMLRKVLFVYFFPGMQPSQLGKSVWLEQWMMGPEELQSSTLFFLSCFYSSCILRHLLVHSTKAEECFIGDALSASIWKTKCCKEFLTSTSTCTCILWVLHPVLPIKVVWRDTTSE